MFMVIFISNQKHWEAMAFIGDGGILKYLKRKSINEATFCN